MSTNNKSDINCHNVLKFFGGLTASVTHELNNTIGIINENAGLLEDLGLMAKSGMAPDIDKWMEITRKITEHIRRTRETLRNLNKFSHSTDNIKSLVNPYDLLNLVVSLSKKRLSEKNVTAFVVKKDESFNIYTSPFLFLHLTGTSLMHAADQADENKKIIISADGNDKMLCITFSGIINENNKDFPDESTERIMNILDAKIKFPEDQDKFLIFITKHKSI